MDPVAGIVAALLGLAVSPLVDRLATNAPVGSPLLARAPLSRAFPLVAVASAALAGASALVYRFTLEALIGALFCWALVVVTRTDFEHRLIPDRIVLPSSVLVLALRTVDDPSVEWILGALGACFVLFVLVLAYPTGMGMGDVKLALLLGAGLGLGVVVALFLGFVTATVPAIALLVRYGRAARKQSIALGPFLALGGVVALFAGDAILDWYWS